MPPSWRAQLGQAGAQLLASRVHVVEEAGLGEDVDGGQRGGAADRVAAVGAAVAALRPAPHQGFGRADRRDREARAEALRHHDHVGPHAVVLDREHLAGAAEAGLHLVGDEQDAVLAADLFEAAEERHRCREVAAFTELGFDDHRRGLGGRGLRLEQEAHLVEAPVAVRVVSGEGRDEHARGQRPVPGAVARLRGRHRHRLVRAAVKAALEHDRVGPAGRLLRELHRALSRLGARVREEEAVDAIRSDLREPVRELLQQRVAIHVDLCVDELRRLLLDRGDDLRMAVPGARHRDARREVEVLGAVRRRDP